VREPPKFIGLNIYDPFLPLEIYLSYLSDRKMHLLTTRLSDLDYTLFQNLQSRMTDWSRWEFEIIEIL
jgi:hypothetical protein